MLMVNVLPFVVLAVLVVGAKPSNEGFGECFLMLKHFRGSIILWWFGGLSQFLVSVCGYIHNNVAVYG